MASSPATQSPCAGTEFAGLERDVLPPPAGRRLLGQEDPRQAGGWGGGEWGAGLLPEYLWGLGEWHVQWLVPGLCPQVTQGGTKQAGLYPRACPSLACDADGGQWPLGEGKSPARSSVPFICMKQGYEGTFFYQPGGVFRGLE